MNVSAAVVIVAAGLALTAGRCMGSGAQPEHGDVSHERLTGAVSFPDLPGRDSILLPEAVNSIRVLYSSNIGSAQFRALLNGKDITHFFQVRQGSEERISLPLVRGQNLLFLQFGARDSSDRFRLMRRRVTIGYGSAPRHVEIDTIQFKSSDASREVVECLRSGGAEGGRLAACVSDSDL